MYVFGVLLIYSSYKLYQERNKPLQVETNIFIKWAQKSIPLRTNYKGRRFFLYSNGKWLATPAFLALVIIEISDIVFALDSIPAIFAITLDPFIVFTSNIFAILGLRSLYFLMAYLIPRFYYLRHALAIILAFVGIKLLLSNHFKVSLELSLGVIMFIFVSAIFASLWKDRCDKESH